MFCANYLLFYYLCAISVLLISSRTVRFSNKCSHDIWISPLTKKNGPTLAPGIKKLAPKEKFSYEIPNGGWEGRFWPKTGCDANGQACEVGQSTPPCPGGGCSPPSDTKVEFFFPPLGSSEQVWYDVSLVDGYSLSAEIIPSKTAGSCTKTKCAMALSSCPIDEKDVGDLRVRNKAGNILSCLSPCKKWNFPGPIGLGRDEQTAPGKWLCCPTPPVSSPQCQSNLVINTKYVALVHQQCSTAYSFSYDDKAGLHNCPNNVDFKVYFCS